MKKAPTAEKDMAALLERLAQLEQRVQQLEAEKATAAMSAAPAPLSVPAASPAPAVKAPEPISEEVVLAISAAVAAYLGKRATVRQIRLIGNEAWAQQGRVSIMASHRWAMHRN